MKTNNYIPHETFVRQNIHSIWQVDGHTGFRQECIIPKGVVEVIFNFSGSIKSSIGNTQFDLPNCFINGFNTQNIQNRLPEQQSFFGIIFQPFAIKNIFGIPAREFTDITIDLTLIDPTIDSLWHKIAEQQGFDKRVLIFIDWLKTKHTELQSREQFMNDFLYMPNQHLMSVNELAHTMCYSPRQLSRKLYEATAMNAESILLYKKYLHAVSLIHNTALPLTDIAYQSGFYDQSHFIKTFKAYTGTTPGDYSRQKSPVRGHLYQDVR